MKGFTLIETMVVVVLMGLLLTATSTMLINTMKAKNRTVVMEKIEQNSSEIMRQIKNQILNADTDSFVCPDEIGNSITFKNKYDNGETTIRCNEDTNIASDSANYAILNSSDTVVTNCPGFVSCSTLPSVDGGAVSNIEFIYYLSSGNTLAGAQDYSKKLFKFNIGIRN